MLMTIRPRMTDWYRQGPGTPLSSIILDHNFDSTAARCAVLLLDAGADPNFHSEETTFDDRNHYSPLYIALDKSIKYPYPDEETDYILERMIRGSHVALTASTTDGAEQSILLYAFSHSILPPLWVVKELLEMGCDINETAGNVPNIPDGWSCLFLQVLRARHPENSSEIEVTRFLIKQRANLFVKDGSGLTIFDHANAILSGGSSSYRRDLWYCALQREGINNGATFEVHPRIAKYNRYYTPEHYRALCYLDHWTEEDLSGQLHESLEACPWSEEEISELSRINHEKEAAVARSLEERRAYFNRRRQRRLEKTSQETNG